jgi:hypothetical protein
MHELIKPDGTKVLVNDESLAHALSLGWKKAEVKPSGNSPKRNK